MKGKCDCGKPATSEWMIIELPTTKKRGSARTMKWCDKCKPKGGTRTIYQI
jgi:hypothetical protein